MQPETITFPYLLAQNLQELTWNGYKHEGDDEAEKRHILFEEFFTLENPMFLFYHELPSVNSRVRGFLAFERSFQSLHQGKRSDFWESVAGKYPELLQFLLEEPLLLSVVSGVVVDPDWQNAGVGKALMREGLAAVAPQSDIILGMTKNPAAIGLRKRILREVANDSFDFWVGRTPLTDTTPAFYPHFVQQLTSSYVQTLGGRMSKRPGYEDVAVIPQPYLPKPFHVKSKTDLQPTEKQWIGRLFDEENVIGQNEVAVHALIAMSKRFRQLYATYPQLPIAA